MKRFVWGGVGLGLAATVGALLMREAPAERTAEPARATRDRDQAAPQPKTALTQIEEPPSRSASLLASAEVRSSLEAVNDPLLPAARRVEALLGLSERAPPAEVARATQVLLTSRPGGALEAESLRLLGRLASDPSVSVSEVSGALLRSLVRTDDAEVALAAGNAFEALGAGAVDPMVLENAFFGLRLVEARVVTLRLVALARGPTDSPRLLSFLRQVVFNDESVQVRGEALVLASSLGGRESLTLIQSSFERYPELRVEAARALGRMRGDEADLLLVAAWKQGSRVEVADVLAAALLNRGGGLLLLTQASVGVDVRAEAAVAALSRTNTDQGAGVLREVVTRGANTKARAGALLALVRTRRLGRDTLEEIATSDPSPVLRGIAVDALRKG